MPTVEDDVVAYHPDVRETVMGKSKSRFDLNRDWITYGDLIQ